MSDSCIFAGKSEVKVINFINFLALKDLFRGEREERMTDEGRYLILSSVVGASTGNSFTSCITCRAVHVVKRTRRVVNGPFKRIETNIRLTFIIH